MLQGGQKVVMRAGETWRSRLSQNTTCEVWLEVNMVLMGL